MKKQYFLLFLIFICVRTNAQTNLDSLFRIWEDYTSSDSIRADAFMEYISEGFFYSDPDSAITLTKQLYDFSEKASYQTGMVEALIDLGYAYFRIGDYPKALESYKKGLDLAEENNDKSGAGYLLLRTGFIYHDNGDIITALNYYQRSLKLFEETDDLEGIGSVYNEFGSIYRAEDENAKALEYYLKSIAINEELDNGNGNSAMYHNIGSLYLNQKEFFKALDYFQKGQLIYEENGDKLGIASGLEGMGNVYSEQGDDVMALEYLKKSLALSEEIDNTQGSTKTLLNIGVIYADQEKYSESLEYCKKSLDKAKELGDIGGQASACDCLYTAYKGIGNLDQALIFHEQMLVFDDSLKSEDTAKQLQQMEFAKQVLADSLLQVEKDLKVEMVHQAEVQKKDRNRNLAIAAGLFFLLLSGGLFNRWRYVKKAKTIIEKEKDRSESLLLNILPSEIAEELKEKGSADARDFNMVSILFSDFVGFTEISERQTAKELVAEINHCFKAFDNICEKYGVEKIKTIGDAYMAAGGLPVPSDDSAKHAVLAALEMQAFIIDRKVEKEAKDEIPFEMRVGIHTGPVVAGIVGVKKFQYDIWGDTVNIASRMESSGAIGKVNVSQDTYELIKGDSSFAFEARGKIKAKGKGEIEMFFVSKSS